MRGLSENVNFHTHKYIYEYYTVNLAVIYQFLLRFRKTGNQLEFWNSRVSGKRS